MDASDVRRVLMVGAGTMGQQIGLQCALFGLDVVVHDVDPGALERYREAVARLAEGHVRHGFVTAEQRDEALARIRTEADLAAAARDADVVVEAIPEDPDLKRELWSRLGPLCPERALLTTNTSTLLPSMYADATGRPERFLAWHFHLPVLVSNVVDVMGHPGTDPACVETVVELSKRIGQVPIRVDREYPGYVFNTMLVAFLRAAQRLVLDGVASPQDVDRAWMGVTKMPIGPFGILDQVGLDTALHITRSELKLSPESGEARRIAEWLARKVEAGELGAKTGKGFYSYPNPAYAQPGFLTDEL